MVARLLIVCCLAGALLWPFPPAAVAQETDAPPPGIAPAVGVKAEETAPDDPLPGLTRLAKDYALWMDPKRKLVVVNGEVCLREGQLEMFACPKGTKEHESIVTINCPARFVHAGLLAVGAKPGKPVQFDPIYVAASGVEVEVLVLWIDKEGKKKKVRAQEWIKNIKTNKPMEYPWVFAGSGFWKDEQSGQLHYHGDAGDFICVSNFPTATLDLPVQSSQANAALLFEAFTERIPPMRTKVRLVLRPLAAAKDSKSDATVGPPVQP